MSDSANPADTQLQPTLDPSALSPEQRAGMLMASLLALRETIGRMFGVKDVIYTGGREAIRRLYQQSGKVTQPFIALRIEQMELNHTYNHSVARRTGVNLGRSRDGQSMINMKITPIVVRIAFYYYCQGWIQQFEFAETWLHRRRRLSFQLEVSKAFIADFTVKADDNVTFAEVQFMQEGGPQIEADANLVLETYIGRIVNLPTIKDVEMMLTNAEDLTAALNDPELAESLEAVYQLVVTGDPLVDAGELG